MAVLFASVFVATIESFLSLIFEVKAMYLPMFVERLANSDVNKKCHHVEGGLAEQK